MDAQQFATAYTLTTSIGLRAFVTLLLASVAMHLGYLHPSPPFAWLGSNGATIALAALALLELGSDKIPIVDHFMHAVHFATKPIAAALLVGSIVPDPSGSLTGADYALMALGAANALGVHTASATVRTASTVSTMGIANPAVSVVEDLLASGGVILSLVLPIVAALGAIVITIVLFILARRIWRTTRPRAI